MKVYFILLLLPKTAAADQGPGMLTLTFELGFLAALIIALVKVDFAMEKKGIVFLAYILLGVLTKSIWLPVLITSVLFFFLAKSDSDKQ